MHSAPVPAAVPQQTLFTRKLALSLAIGAAFLVGGCQATGLSTAVGPSRGTILSAGTAQQVPGMQVIPVTNEVANLLSIVEPNPTIAELIG